MSALVSQRAYIDLPIWARWLERALFVLCYALFGVAGYAATTLNFPAQQAGYVIMGACLIALGGVVSGFYQLELLALWPIIFAFGAVVVYLQVPPQNAVLTGWLVGAYMPLLGVRLLVLNLLASKARKESTREAT